jgi:hypothetical protein
MRNSYTILVQKSEVKRLLEGSKRRWEGKLRSNLRELRWESVDWINMPQNRDQ